MAPGDVFIMNDPFDGGMHLPDIFVFKPLYHEGRRMAFACTVCHHTDVGGRVAGSNASDSTEIYAEGLRIAPLKLYEAGKINKTIMTFIEKNVRLPVKVFGDLRAQLAACHIAEQQFAELVKRYGPDQTSAFMRETVDYAERLTRSAIAKLPDGEWSFEDWIDGRWRRLRQADPAVRDHPQERRPHGRRLDGHQLAGQGARSTTRFPSPRPPPTRASARCCLAASRTRGRVPRHRGDSVRPAPWGNGVLPAACAARGLTGFRMVDCMFGALAMMLPDKVKAAGDGGNTGISIGGYDANRKPFIYVDFTCGAWGARPWADGPRRQLAHVRQHGLALDRGDGSRGADPAAGLRVRRRQGGRRQVPRRGVPFRRDYRFLEEEGTLQVRSDRRDFRPFGLYGGSPGGASQNYLNPQAENKVLPGKFTMTVKKGDIFRHVLAGAGGWGDPLERDPAAVLKDVRNELLSPAKALADYGVMIDTVKWVVDTAATVKRHDEIRRARGWTEVPKVQREDPPGLADGAVRAAE